MAKETFEQRDSREVSMLYRKEIDLLELVGKRLGSNNFWRRLNRDRWFIPDSLQNFASRRMRENHVDISVAMGGIGRLSARRGELVRA